MSIFLRELVSIIILLAIIFDTIMTVFLFRVALETKKRVRLLEEAREHDEHS